MIGEKILVIDDEQSMRKLLFDVLSDAGYRVLTAVSGPDGLSQLFDYQPALVILDIMMPNIDGWETLEHIREVSAVPVIILTAIAEEAESVARGLDSGAVDYISKPFDNQILIARVRAALRQANTVYNQAMQLVYRDDRLRIDLRDQSILVDDKPVDLTRTEFQLLAYLFQHAGRVLTYEQILNQVWGTGAPGNVASVHVYLSRLRQKLEKDPGQPRYLLTVHGVGCRAMFA